MVVGGIFGNILGAKTTEGLINTVKNPHFYVAAIYTIPATTLLLLAININGQKVLIVFLIFICIIALFTNLAPMASISITCIHPKLRGYSCSLQIFFQHVLGDMISPVIIGAISDDSNSLRAGLQITWMAVLLSGIFWFIGYFYLIPLETSMLSSSSHHSSASSSSPTKSSMSNTTNTTYLELLFGYKSKKNMIQVNQLNGDVNNDYANEDIASEMIRLESR